MAECEAQAHIPRSILKSARKESAESFRAHRILLGPLLKWIFSKAADSVDWGAHLRKFQALREELKYDADKKLVLDKAEVAFGINKGMSLLFSLLDRRSNLELPPALKGLDEVQIQRRLLASDEALKQVLRAELGKFAANGKA